MFRLPRLGLLLLVLGTGTGLLRADEAPASKPATDTAAKSANPPASSTSERWQVIFMGKSRVGYSRSSIETVERDGQPQRIAEAEAVLVINRFGQSIKMKTLFQTRETLEGQIQGFTFELHNPPSAVNRTTGVVQGEKVLLETEIDGTVSKAEKAWDPAIRGLAWQELDLKQNPIQAGETRKYTTYDPQFAKADVVTMKAGKLTPTKLLGTAEQELLPVSVAHSVFPAVQSMEYLDATGESRKSTMSLLSTTAYTVTKEEALKSLSGGEVDLGISTLVKLPQPLAKAQSTRKVVYKLTTEGVDPLTILKAGPPQSVERLSDDSVKITVVSLREPPAAPAAVEAPAAEYLDANSFLQTADKRVVEFANTAAGTETDPWKIAQAMEKWVAQNLKKKNFSTLLASAGEVARTLSGDCTEHAVLLAAMARVKQIPSRCVVGLVYVPRLNAFGGHMWTEVWISGTWMPLDATLGLGYVAGEHIKFGESSFAGVGNAPLSEFVSMAIVLGSMQLEVLEAE